jgi:hypothetical protein
MIISVFGVGYDGVPVAYCKERGVKVTAFPVDQALGDLQPGVYVMTASAKGPGSGDDDGSLARAGC